ncbi:MAG: hypothetical protein P8M22_06115 [Phycisphaerales bacterium]|nr:hypothetical protein [Phycisphaerales bacterium]
MKTMLATIGICVAMAAAGCAQKADSSATLAAFDDNKSSASCCMSKTPGNGCPMAAKQAAASTGCCKSKAASSCSKSKSETVSN